MSTQNINVIQDINVITPEECWRIAKSGDEKEVREALSFSLLRQSENAVDIGSLIEMKAEANMLRRARLNQKQWKLISTALRARITVLNNDKRMRVKPREETLNLTPSTLRMLVSAMQLMQPAQRNGKQEPIKIENKLNQPIVTGDIQADNSYNSIREKMLAGKSLSEIAQEAGTHTFSANDLLKRENDITSSFEPNEDGSVEL